MLLRVVARVQQLAVSPQRYDWFLISPCWLCVVQQQAIAKSVSNVKCSLSESRSSEARRRCRWSIASKRRSAFFYKT